MSVLFLRVRFDRELSSLMRLNRSFGRIKDEK
jgi:hypothetical protein